MGGLNPKLRLSYYEELLRALKARFPWIHLKALTMVELDFLAGLERIAVDEVVRRLRAAGLDSCPGGGAEIFAERVRTLICDHKTDGARWLEVARTVHDFGLRSNCTMLYGHIETAEERVDHLLAPARAAGLQPAASSAASRSPSTPPTPGSTTCRRPAGASTCRPSR